MMSVSAPGWYPDPQQAGQQRYWDGATWHTGSGDPDPRHGGGKPWVWFLGAMALVGPLQMDTGAALGVPPTWSNGLHNAAAGWGIIAGPARLQVGHGMAAGAQTPDMPGWTVTRRNLFVVLLPTMLAGVGLMSLMGWLLLPRA